MIAPFLEPGNWAALVTLTAMEIVLGIDNVVFVSVMVSRLPSEIADKARKVGLALALVFRIVLLLILSWIIGLSEPVIKGFGVALSWRDIILIAGGAFLIYKATHEIHDNIEEPDEDAHEKGAVDMAFSAIVLQIVAIDAVFSIDSIVTAIGMAQHVEIMIAAVIIAMAGMYFASGTIAGFIARHPTTKMLALAFLLMIGITLVADGLGFHIPKGYIYSAMAFSVVVESFNILAKARRDKKKAAQQES